MKINAPQAESLLRDILEYLSDDADPQDGGSHKSAELCRDIRTILGIPSPAKPKPEPDLKPCPFCGEEAIAIAYTGENTDFVDPVFQFGVECTNVNCSAVMAFFKTKEGAIADWNRRADKCTEPEPEPGEWVTHTPVSRRLNELIGAYGLSCSETKELAPTTELADQLKLVDDMEQNQRVHTYNGEPPKQFGLEECDDVLWYDDTHMRWDACRWRNLTSGDRWMKQFKAPEGEKGQTDE